ncbi:MAG: proline dehydrogenase, partial [Marmoricola sp.]|nr:proline dehydrogenase [Marmoricola sp.]
MLRHILLLLARSRQVKDIVTRMPVSSGIVHRYVPGEET